MALDRLDTALWRFEMIAPLLDPCLDEEKRSKLIDQLSTSTHRWPSGREGHVGRSTLYRWQQVYLSNPHIESLLPSPRKRGTTLRVIKSEWIDYALALLEEEPKRSVFVLQQRIQNKFGLAVPPARASLHRALARSPRYARTYSRKAKQRRVRFVAAQVNQIWQADAKADFSVTFTDGSVHRVRILSIIDDRSRYILASLTVESESLIAACRTFRDAALRYGLPLSFYADRGSAYDAEPFRRGLAMLGVRRIDTKPRNPSAHGKIEAYNRVLDRWFITELPHQPVDNLDQLQALLDAFNAERYNKHYHREIKATPAEAFGAPSNPRIVSLDRLSQAFVKTSQQRPHPKTGDVRVDGVLWKIPNAFLCPRRPLTIAQNLLDPSVVWLVDNQAHFLPLQPAVRVNVPHTPPPSEALPSPGSLSPLLQTYRGRILPQAVAGFGLPEIYHRLGNTLRRPVPDTEHEAALILRWLKKHGPFHPDRFDAAVSAAIVRIGTGRPLALLLDELTRRIKQQPDPRKDLNP